MRQSFSRYIATNIYQLEWLQPINTVSETSGSGGRLNIYRKIKKDLNTESYVASRRSVGVRRVLVGLRVGCLPLAVETGHYMGSTAASGRVRFEIVGRWRIKYFLIICLALWI